MSTEPASRKTKPNPREHWLKVQATHVVAILPENNAEARKVLAYAAEIVDKFLAEDDGPKPVAIQVVKEG